MTDSPAPLGSGCSPEPSDTTRSMRRFGISAWAHPNWSLPTTKGGSTSTLSRLPSKCLTLRRRADDRPSWCSRPATFTPGAFDDFGPAIEIAHRHGAWVHIDGAFGLFAGASPKLAHLVEGYAAADSWTTDAHKTLNAPYDCGIAIVRRPEVLRAAMGMHGDYLITDAAGDPFESVPETSRRARAIPVWAVLHSLGRTGVADLVDGFVGHAQAFASGLAEIEGVEVLNDVCFTQVCASFGSDERTQAVVQAILADGTAWMSGSKWRDRAVLRISVSNWSTTDDDVRRSLDAVKRAATHP